MLLRTTMAKFNLLNLVIAAAFALLLPLQKGLGVPCVTAFSTVSKTTPASSTTPTRFARFGNDNNNHYHEPAAILVSRNGYVKTNKYDSTTVYAASRLFSSSSSRDVASLLRPRALIQAHVSQVWKRWIAFWATALQQWRKEKIQAPLFPWTMARCCSWRQGYKAVRRKVLCLLLSVLLVLGVSDAALAVTGGRAGGTFKSSHRPSVGRSYAPLSRPPRQYYSRPRPVPHVIVTSPSLPMSYNNQLVVARSAPSALGTYLAVGGVAGLVAYSTVQEQRRRGGGGSGSARDASTYGATSTAITVALNIPNRDNPNSIVRRINEISKRTDTSTQSGVQMLISEACLELVRQQASLQAAWSDSNHYKSSNAALKDFQGRSVANRSRYDQETMSNFNAQEFDTQAEASPTVADGKATMAVVSIHFVTEGEDISHFKNMRADVVNLLRWTAATIPVASLLAGEVLWSPQQATDTLTKQDIDERYPELSPLI